MDTTKFMTIRDLEREAEQIALHGEETAEHAFERLLEANPQVYAAYGERYHRSTSKKVCEAAGVEERTLRAWQLRGLLKIEASPPGEKWRRYSFADVICISLMKRLTQAGFSARHAADCVNDNRKYWEDNPRSPFYLLISFTEYGIAYFGTNTKEGVTGILHPADSPEPDTVTVIAVHRVADDVHKKLFH